MKSPTYKILTIHDLFLLMFFLGLISFLSVSLFLFNENNKAIWYMSQTKYEEAEEILLKNLNKDIFSLLYRLNLAFNYTLSSQYTKSLQEYQIVKRSLQEGGSIKEHISHLQETTTPSESRSTLQESPTDKLLFYTSFNSAVASTQKGETDRALNFYQQALDIKPDSLETKTNIELLIKDNNQKKQTQQQNKENDSTQEEQQKDSSQENDQEQQQNSSNDNDSQLGKDKKSTTEKEEQFQISEEQKENKGSTQTDNKKTQIFNKQQIEAILKSIQDQEKEIRKKQLEGQKQYSRQNTNDVKDW